MTTYRTEYDTRLLYTQSYLADETIHVGTDTYAVMWTYPGAVQPTTTRVRITYLYTKEGTGISPIQGVLEQWKSEGWLIFDEFCDGYLGFNEVSDFRNYLMQMTRSFLLGVPLGAEVEGDVSPKPPAPNKATIKKKPTALKSRIEKMIKQPKDSNSLTPDEDDIFASAKIIKAKPLKSGSKDENSDDDDDDDTWI
tara:strand:+ start:219 stop:803 length:585 start_codon:yes stop_codon:yes gene_type:complete